MSFDLSNQYVSQSYQNLVQISSSILVNGLGATINQLNITATGSFTTLGYQSFRNPDHPTLQFTQNSTSVPALTVFDTVQTASIQIKYTTGSKNTAVITSFNTASFASSLYAYETSSARLAGVSADWSAADNTFSTAMTFITGSDVWQLGVGEDGPYISTSYATSGSNLFVIQNGDAAQILNVYANGDFKQTNADTTMQLFNLSSSVYDQQPGTGFNFVKNDSSVIVGIFDDTIDNKVLSGIYQQDTNTDELAYILTIYDNTLTDSPTANLAYINGSGNQAVVQVSSDGITLTGLTSGSDYNTAMFNTAGTRLFGVQNNGHVTISGSLNVSQSIQSNGYNVLTVNQTGSMLQPYVLTSSTASMLQPYVLTTSTASMLQPYVLTSVTSSMLSPYVLNSATSSFVQNSVTSSMLAPYVLTSVTSSMLAPYVLTSVTSSMSVLSSSYAVSSSYVVTASYANFALNSSVSTSGSTLYSTDPTTNNFSTSNGIFLGLYSGQFATNANESNFLGLYAGQFATNANESNFLGISAGLQAINANNSNFFGYQAGYQATNANNSNFFGYQAGYKTDNASYSNLIGYQVGFNPSGPGIGPNNIIAGTNITLENNRKDSINLGGIIFATGSYSTTTGNPFSGSMANAKVGIGTSLPAYTLDVSGSVRINDILKLQLRSTTPAAPEEGMIIASGSAGASVLYYYNGTTWNALF